MQEEVKKKEVIQVQLTHKDYKLVVVIQHQMKLLDHKVAALKDLFNHFHP